MTRQRKSYVRAGDTEPHIMTISAPDLADLDDVTEALLFCRLKGATENHVDGAECTVSDSENFELTFDPIDNGPEGADAFGTGDEGVYQCYIKITMTDGDTARFPTHEDGTFDLHVSANYEG